MGLSIADQNKILKKLDLRQGRRGVSVSLRERGLIVSAYQRGVSKERIAKYTKRSWVTIHKIVDAEANSTNAKDIKAKQVAPKKTDKPKASIWIKPTLDTSNIPALKKLKFYKKRAKEGVSHFGWWRVPLREVDDLWGAALSDKKFPNVQLNLRAA